MSYDRRKAYQEYLKSDDWAWVKEQAIRRDGGCTRCGKVYRPGGGFDVHHLHYRYVGQADLYELESVTVLCRGCHQAAHGITPPENNVLDLEAWFRDNG